MTLPLAFPLLGLTLASPQACLARAQLWGWTQAPGSLARTQSSNQMPLPLAMGGRNDGIQACHPALPDGSRQQKKIEDPVQGAGTAPSAAVCWHWCFACGLLI